jgi:DNA-binding GntR family transcriptional regulator
MRDWNTKATPGDFQRRTLRYMTCPRVREDALGEVTDFASEDLAGADRPNLTEQVYEQLISLLLSGELRPNDVITERRMAEQLNASRTPIREALGRLESEGLVYKQAGRGVTVSPFSTEVFLEILNVRLLLEAQAAWLAAGSISPQRVTEIRAALKKIGANKHPTLSEIWEVDDMLHGEIADAAGNALMASMIRDLRRRTHVFSAYRKTLTPSVDVKENSYLLDAVASGDRVRAREAMAQHIEAVKSMLIDRLAGTTR